MLLPTSLVGSYAQPDWLIDREKLAGRFPPRTRMKELWRVPEQYLEQAWDDATVYAIAECEVEITDDHGGAHVGHTEAPWTCAAARISW